MESEANAAVVVGVVIVGVAVAVHIAEIVGVARIRRTLPPPFRSTKTTVSWLDPYIVKGGFCTSPCPTS